MSWAQDEFKTLELGDQRLNARAVLLAERLANKPTESIPNACLGWAETQAAYRFLSNPRTDWQAVLAPHWASSLERMRGHAVVLNIQDTTELDFNGRQATGLGPLSYEAQRGMYLHPTYTISPAREPLGVLDAWMWAREPKDSSGKRPGIKESLRWIEGYERVAERAQALPEVRQVYVADREADILALLVKARDLEYVADYLIRCQHNRALPEGDKLWARLAQAPVLGSVRFELPAGRGRKARSVQQSIRAEQVELPDGTGGRMNVTCLLVEETNPPADTKPVVWRLLSNRQVNTLEQAVELIDWYRARWEIELFFLILKEGCHIEALQLGSAERIETALALYLVVAWRVNRLMRLGRSLPELPADLLFEADEWQAAYILNKKPVPKKTPDLNSVVRLIAQLGGFLGRKGDGEPGAKTLWLGLRDIAVFVQGVRFARLQL
ncbi:MAG: IS4 family transposase [Polaromonas sp.]